MAWTYLKVGTATRAQAVDEERKVRALHAAEAGIRRYLYTGQTTSFWMNDCKVSVIAADANLTFQALPTGSKRATTITLQTYQGYITGRNTNEEN